eukprot:CAMPEP_0183372140 /NCGR_PEP_ID=MMETSP0164_2-20130417/107654_1 /TAXON_ID=221442 /ORGANISM="Coccolithus pelagicus ssp braarudi, Strain PLY182g" /LENGTH=156 /DNA_ID=CAMNT_0025548809 /DNA_START=39 /DNA_END=509 /DNA_ORIENTATION=-
MPRAVAHDPLQEEQLTCRSGFDSNDKNEWYRLPYWSPSCQEKEMLLPNLGQVFRVIVVRHVGEEQLAWAVHMRAVHHLGFVIKHDWVKLSPNQVLSIEEIWVHGGKLGLGRLCSTWRGAYALDADDPTATPSKHVVSNTLGSRVPIGVFPKPPACP